MSYWLSILVPVHNVQPWLQECLASVMEQADAGVQVLVLDDASTDASWPLMQTLATRWPTRLQLLQHATNQGLSAARNSLIEAASGEWLWFLDSDDKLLPGALHGLRTIVQTHAPDVVLCDSTVWREHERLKHRLRGEHHRRSFHGPQRALLHDRHALLAGLLHTGQLHAWSKISRRVLWGNGGDSQNTAALRFPQGRCFEDMATMPLLALRAASFWYEPRPWVAYRQRASSILATMNAAKALDQSAALIPLAQALHALPLQAQSGQNETLQMALAHQCARNLIGAMRCRTALPQTSRPAFAQQLRNDFLATSPLSAQQWLQACLRRGWWLRAAKFMRAWTVE